MTLRAVVESFVLREGTDYGAQEVPFERKVADVLRQLERREAIIVYDPEPTASTSSSAGRVVSRDR